jgi:thiopurine S-methyltransferase
MKTEFWLERWRSNQIGFHQHDVNTSLQTHWAHLALPSDGTVFVPLCGKSLDMLWLRAQGYAVLGVEFIQIAVHDFFAENELTPFVSAQPPFERWEADGVALLCGDFFDLNPLDLTGVVAAYDRAALIALPPELRARYVDKFYEILPPAAETLLITVSYPETEMTGPPFSVGAAEVQSLYADKFAIDLLASRDALADNEQLRARGLSQLTEHVYRIRPSPSRVMSSLRDTAV